MRPEGEQPRHPGLPKPKRPPRGAQPLEAKDPYALEFDLADVSAIQALFRGEANQEQQKRGMDWILAKACAMGDWAYKPGMTNNDTHVALGRQFAGSQIIGLAKKNLATLRHNEALSDPPNPAA